MRASCSDERMDVSGAVVTVEHSGKVYHKSTEVVKLSTSPTFKRDFKIFKVFDDSAEVRITLYDAHLFGLGDKPLGSLGFLLRDMQVIIPPRPSGLPPPSTIPSLPHCRSDRTAPSSHRTAAAAALSSHALCTP